jgi:hypothetical protein
MTKYTVQTITTKVEFMGKYLPDREKPNWHYYMGEFGAIYHFRKEHMVFVIEEELHDKNTY